MIIVGPPGTGKTTALLNCLVNNCVKKDFDPGQRQRVFMFNKSVEVEFRERLKKKKNDMKNTIVSTLDSFAVQKARVEGYLLLGCKRDFSGHIVCKNVEDEINRLRARIAAKYNLEYSFDIFIPAAGNLLFNHIDSMLLRFPNIFFQRDFRKLINLKYADSRILKYIHLVPRVAEEYISYLLRNNRADFTLAKLITLNACRRHGHIDEVDTLVVDEAQDLTYTEWQILKNCIVYRDYLLAGDPLQSIYTWRGAEPDLFVELIKRERGSVVVLTKSYRLAKNVAEFALKYAYDNLHVDYYYYFEGKDVDARVEFIRRYDVLRYADYAISQFKQVALLTATNIDVLRYLLDIAIFAWSRGLTLMFLKSIPHALLRLVEFLKTRDISVLDVRMRKIVMFKYAALLDEIRDKANVMLYSKNAEHSIILDTVFTAKGLEFNSVIFLTPRRVLIDRDLYHRLFFVAITRSLNDVYITLPPTRKP